MPKDTKTRRWLDQSDRDLSSITVSDITDLSDYASGLTDAEIQQLQNINTTTISAAQWAYLGELDQALKKAASPTFAGFTQVGDATNKMTVAADGEIGLEGTARVTTSMWIDAGAIKAPGAKPATAVAHGTLETPAWEFGDEAVEGNQETVSFSMKVPEDMDKTAAPSLCIGWSANGASPGVGEWQLEYLYTAEGEASDGAAEETLTGNEAAPATSHGLVVTPITGVNTPGASDACIHGRITRLSAGGTDTIAASIYLHGISFIYTINKLGAAT